jgi:hypothetical protein
MPAWSDQGARWCGRNGDRSAPIGKQSNDLSRRANTGCILLQQYQWIWQLQSCSGRRRGLVRHGWVRVYSTGWRIGMHCKPQRQSHDAESRCAERRLIELPRVRPLGDTGARERALRDDVGTIDRGEATHG